MPVTLTRHQPIASSVTAKDQELFANALVLKFVSQYFNREQIKVQISGRGKWYNGSAGNQIIIHPINHGISKRNIVSMGAYWRRRNPVSAVHLFARDPTTIDQMREEIDRIIITYGVNPYKGVQYIQEADIPSVSADDEPDDAGTLYRDIVYLECLYYKNRG